jgi:hypothetical protein
MSRARWLALPVVTVLGWAADYMYAHPYGDRFAIGIWPVPQGTPWTYQLESGFVPALTVVSLVTLLGGAWHHVNCHQSGCARIGKHKVDGTPWCSLHHEAARQKATATLDDVVARLDTLASLIEDIAAGRRYRR